jgi:hypothetical protein
MSQTKQKFHHLKEYIDSASCNRLYEFLRDNVKWEEGIMSKKRHTRSALPYDLDDFIEFIDDFLDIIEKVTEVIYAFSQRKFCEGLYLNYYKDGNDWTPNHTHPGTTQIIISLGTTRTFQYGKKDIPSQNGDILIFGSGLHGVPKDPDVTNGRISIALFMYNP